MFFGGGFPGFPGMGGPRVSQTHADRAKFCGILGVDKDASIADIKKAYKKLALIHHPDVADRKGGDPEKFKEIDSAYKALINSDGDRGPRRKTKDLVQPMKCTLEQMYTGQIKTMAITRRVIDKANGIQRCDECDGCGVKMQTIQMGPMIQQMQSACESCGGQGKTFKTKSEREVLEVHVQKGCFDGQKIAFREKAHEHPDADTGDVIFVCKQEEHPQFKRKGADLFIQRTISLAEALCGFQLELTHLDGRKLLIRTSPGDIVKPMMQGFDPLAENDGKMEWDVMEGYDCPDIDNVAQADTTDVDTLKKACETQLKQKGIDVGVFVVDGPRSYFKQGSREEIMAARRPKKNCTMYVLADPNAKKSMRVMKAVKNEGMPTYKNPFVHGNLFLILNIDFPDKLTPETQNGLKGLLPPPLLSCSLSEDDPSVEVHTLTEIDPVQSCKSNKVNMEGGGEAYDEDAEGGRGMRSPGGQCQQM